MAFQGFVRPDYEISAYSIVEVNQKHALSGNTFGVFFKPLN